ncbi:helix-turn-helix transcriptional regulator [Mesorhizobium sp. UC22_110]|uniref:helix-turn-helix transcriptional regulator n=1 Tax=unclassified Mesorhizobium TaxID=325217 RepID=UPI00366C4E5A
MVPQTDRSLDLPGQGKRVRVRDFMARDGVVLDSPDDRLAEEDTLIEGRLLHQELRSGLFLHGGDVVEERMFTVTSHLKEGLSCIIFLDGQVDLDIGDRHFEFKGNPRSAMRGSAIMSVNSESFRRASRGRQHVRHLVVSATPEWFDRDGLEEMQDARPASRFLKDHLAHHAWTLTPRVIDLVQQVMAPSGLSPALHKLYLEGRAIEIILETLATVTQSGRRLSSSAGIARQDIVRLQRAKELVDSRPGAVLSVEMIARAAGISASGLQRLFRQAEGTSVFEYIRDRRLERAFLALQAGDVTVQGASDIAGYTSPANFATAFRRRFGVTPREIAPARQ